MAAVVSTLLLLAVRDALTIMPMMASNPTDNMTMAIKISTRLKPRERFSDRSIAITSRRLFILDSVVDVDLDLPRLKYCDCSSASAVGVIGHITWHGACQRVTRVRGAGQSARVES